ncbi:31366_t:CDS:1, partial [Racocetra persica]
AILFWLPFVLDKALTILDEQTEVNNNNTTNPITQDIYIFVNKEGLDNNLDINITNNSYDNINFSDEESNFDNLNIFATWFPINKIAYFSTNIYKGKLLSKQQCSNILRKEPRNMNIKYNPLAIDRYI